MLPWSKMKANGTIFYRYLAGGHRVWCVALMFISLVSNAAIAAPEDEVRSAFDRFVVAQNAHDINAVQSLLLASPDFLWITRGTPVWGPEAAHKRFTGLYEGTWRLDPEPSDLRITVIGDRVAQLYVPIVFTIGASGQPAQKTRFLMNQVLLKTPEGWKVSSILPIPAPTQ
jgi:ketosteroid isomerase-like protein